MDVFISWSGERSRAVAEALRNWLPKIINAIKPWLSSEDIDKGARWSSDVASRLEKAKAGIICLTPNNLHSDWILFEAGALSKTLQNTFVCPLLIGLEPSDIKPPLAQFQATRAKKDDLLKLLKTLNTALGEGALPDSHIEEAFEVWWPKLEAQLNALPAEESKNKPHRADRDLLEEILSLVRNQNRPLILSSSHAPVLGTKSEISEFGALVYRMAETLDEKLIGFNTTMIKGMPLIRCYDNDRKKPKYTFLVPENIIASELGNFIASQMVEQASGANSKDSDQPPLPSEKRKL